MPAPRFQNVLRTAIYAAALTAPLFISGCASPEAAGSREVSYPGGEKGESKPVTEAELQEALFRFEAQFQAKTTGALDKLRASKDANIRRIALVRQIAYSSSALEIATRPNPSSALLDMITFIELSREVIHRYWVPQIFGVQGEALQNAFDRFSAEIWKIADTVMTADQKALLQTIISNWQKENPGEIRVEGVRLSQFSRIAASGAERDPGGGLLSSVSSAVVAADAALLLGERAIYYGQRAPFLIRMQADLAAMEIMPEVDGRFKTLLIQTDQVLGEASRVLASAQALLTNLDTRMLAIGEKVVIRSGAILIGIAFIALLVLKLIGHRLALRLLEQQRKSLFEMHRSRKSGRAA